MAAAKSGFYYPIATGIIQTGLHWSSEGHYFEVDEVACCATADKACVIHIRKESL
jgi:hypothetical protein